MSIVSGVVVFLSLTSSIGFAAWTASSTKTATVSAGTIAVSTATSDGAATITSLGHTYTTTSRTIVKPITIRNTGSVVATVSGVAIAATSTSSLPGEQIAVEFWAGTSETCATAAPTVSTTLGAGNVSLRNLTMVIPVNGSALLCTSTKFPGNIAAQAGKKITASFEITTTAGSNWNATDVVPINNRSFTQEIFEKPAPNAPTMLVCEDQKSNKKVEISWTAPAGFTTPNDGYNIYYDGVLETNTAETTVEIKEKKPVRMNITIRAVDANGIESVDSIIVQIEPRKTDGNGKEKGISCAN
ncbi:hypothetical protein ADILRU_1179 [Leifsonia rubra CMS 76R]|nr:hypothetical protein ADILRU_1179 [Leifsonia rubra CMS 76R]